MPDDPDEPENRQRVRCSQDLRAALVAAACAAAPREACGLLGGPDRPGDVPLSAFVPLANTVDTTDRFAIDALAFARAEQDLRARGLRWLGFFHSHPHGPPAPSLRDLRELWPDVLHLIAGRERADWRLVAFRLGRAGATSLRLEYCAR